MKRWSDQEQSLLDEVRGRLGELLTDRPQYPDVVGDRKLLRFIRGHNHDVKKATEMIAKFLTWRSQNNIDSIRDQIVYGGIDHPSKFPKGELILSLIRQVVIEPNATDFFGYPICVESYSFSPSTVLKQITVPDYIEFVKYSLEYRSLVLEQLSENRERALLRSHQEARERGELVDETSPYGVIVHTCVIRDLKGVGIEHAGSKGQEIIKAVIGVSADNYPEMMGKCYMINTPFIFNTLWYFIKGLLAARTIEKVSVISSSYLSELKKRVDVANLPDLVVGGEFHATGEAFFFDASPGGALEPLTGSVTPEVAPSDAVTGIKSEIVSNLEVTEISTSFSESTDIGVSSSSQLDDVIDTTIDSNRILSAEETRLEQGAVEDIRPAISDAQLETSM